ncbi:MAG: deoxyribodipyrimidine photo-lyase/cryptochrome family protein [Poseidonia sp.]
MRVVWLKHDLRLSDHAPLAEALAGVEDVLLLYVVEPERMEQPDESVLHTAWDLANARALLGQVNEMGGAMQIHIGRPAEILDQLHARFSITSLHSHEETGLQWSWDRDKRVASWCEANAVAWREHPWNGVVRRLNDRDRWNSIRNRRMVQPLIEAPTVLPKHSTLACTDNSSGLFPCYTELVQTPLEPGEKAAHAWLASFLAARFRDYLPTISNPATSPEGSSRLSAYLTSGVLSVRQVKHAITAARQSPPEGMDVAAFRKNIDAFASRVSWRCHFVQRLEMETSMNERSINPELDEALGRIDDEERFLAWAEGRTGWPFFDACMRSLRATGWINFRMRAMMQSVAAYTLWLPWQRSGNHLAKLFIDYEPGIHYSQIQMQSGITGINSVRAYSILKQSLDHDMNGDFIRRWVPELAMVPTPHIHEPWTMSDDLQATTGVIIGTTYPAPLVDETEARTEGIQATHAARRTDEVKARSARVYAMHGSRARRFQRRRRAVQRPSEKPPVNPQTTLLDFGD